mgnify:CR=1 FL=1
MRRRLGGEIADLVEQRAQLGVDRVGIGLVRGEGRQPVELRHLAGLGPDARRQRGVVGPARVGLGTRDYSIIEQGMVSRVIDAKPDELRVYLEEAAGISGLYQRRHEAELKLKGAETNLARVDDLLEQVRIKENILKRVESLHEANPMLGLRGVRLGITIPELTIMQVRAIFEAACAVSKEEVDVHPEIMIPLTSHVNELKIQRQALEKEAKKAARGR